MLVLSRQAGQTIMIGDDVFVTVDAVQPDATIITVCGPAALLVGVDRTAIRRTSNSLKVMLKRNDSLRLALDLAIGIVDIREDKVRISIEVASDVSIHRKKVYDAIKRERGG